MGFSRLTKGLGVGFSVFVLGALNPKPFSACVELLDKVGLSVALFPVGSVPLGVY